MQPAIAHYRSVTNPQEFLVDWSAFYQRAYERGQHLRTVTRHAASVRYGAQDSMVMNIFHPAQAGGDDPVAVYIHGGGFAEGHPDFYDFLGEGLLARGITFVSMGYRLAPTRFPECATDVAMGLAALEKYLGSSGSTRARFCLIGHSAGASIAALLGVCPEMIEKVHLCRDAISASVLISGIYDFMPPEPAASFVAPEHRVQASAILHAKNAPPVTLLIHGDPEANRRANPPDIFRDRAVAFEAALRSHGHAVTRLAMPGADHVQTACALEDPVMFEKILGMIRRAAPP